MKHPRDEFKPTECSCDRCKAGCKSQPGSLSPGDMRRIADYLKIECDQYLEFALNHFCASEGTKAVVKGEIFTIPTIVPQQGPFKECVFYKDGRCSVHPVKPFGCGYFDHHMNDKEAEIRSKSQMISTMIDEEYHAMWDFLQTEGKVARPIVDRKKELLCILHQIERKENANVSSVS